MNHSVRIKILLLTVAAVGALSLTGAAGAASAQPLAGQPQVGIQQGPGFDGMRRHPRGMRMALGPRAVDHYVHVLRIMLALDSSQEEQVRMILSQAAAELQTNHRNEVRSDLGSRYQAHQQLLEGTLTRVDGVLRNEQREIFARMREVIRSEFENGAMERARRGPRAAERQRR